MTSKNINLSGISLKPQDEARDTTYGFSRRDMIISVAGGLGLLALGSGINACAATSGGNGKLRYDEFWKQADTVKAGPLVDSLVSAARAQIASSRALTASSRAEVLLGKAAGQKELASAEAQFKKRSEHLHMAKAALAKLTDGVPLEQQADFGRLINTRGMAQMTADLRRVSIQRLLSENILPEEARQAAENLDQGLGRVNQARTFQEMTQLLDQHIDSLMAKRFGNPGLARDICILILLLTSIYIALLIAAILVYVLVCVITLGLLCDQVSVDEIFNDMLDDACGPA